MSDLFASTGEYVRTAFNDAAQYGSTRFPEPRPFQRTAHDALREGAKSGDRCQMLMAPTGAGKTYLGLRVCKEALERGRRAIFICDRTTLIEQTSMRADEYGLSAHGIMQADHPRADRRYPFQIASAQTLARRKWPDADVIVIDEAHTQLKAWTAVIPTHRAHVIGLSATPFSRGLGLLFSRLVNATTMRELTDSGVLVPMRIMTCTPANMAGAETRNGEWTEKAAEKRGMEIVGDVVSEWHQHAAGRKTIVFGATIAHCEEIARQFEASGIGAAVFSARTTASQRAAMLAEYRKPDGDLRVLVSVEALAKGFDCLDRETEILTPSGWRGIGQVAEGDLVYGYDRETGRIEVCDCEGYGERPLRGGERMVEVKSQRFNIRTTEGHQFHIKYRHPKRNFNHQSWQTKTGAEMVGRRSAWGIPLSGFADFPGVDLSDDELRLVAWFMTDGSLHKRTLEICQSKPYKSEIRDLLHRIGLDFNERTVDSSGYANGKPAIRFEIPKGTHSGSLKRNGWSKYAEYLDKGVSRSLMNMTREQFRVFWDELLKGDGAKQGSKAGRLWCDRKEQADAYTQMAVLRGFSASFSIQQTKAGKMMYVVSVRDAQWIGTSASSIAAKFEFSEPASDERVWCVKNRLSTLIVRRHGKIAVIGNCPDVECVVDCRPLRKSLSTAMQMWGRGLRSAPGKSDCLLLDHTGNILRFWKDYEDIYHNGLSALDAGEKLDKAIRTEDDEDKADKACPSCGHKPFAGHCTACGHQARKASEVMAVPGQMVEVQFGKGGISRRELWEQVCAYSRGHSAPEKQAGRAGHLYRDFTGNWPPTQWRFEETPGAPISRDVLNRIKAKNIAFAKRRGAA